MAKFPTRPETQEWRKKLVRELAREFPDPREEDEERFKAALGARVEKDPEARTMVYAAFLDHPDGEEGEEAGEEVVTPDPVEPPELVGDPLGGDSPQADDVARARPLNYRRGRSGSRGRSV